MDKDSLESLKFTVILFLSRPNDSRMLVALGESYEKLSQQGEAKKVGVLWKSETLVSCSRLIEFVFIHSVTGGRTLLAT